MSDFNSNEVNKIYDYCLGGDDKNLVEVCIGDTRSKFNLAHVIEQYDAIKSFLDNVAWAFRRSSGGGSTFLLYGAVQTEQRAMAQKVFLLGIAAGRIKPLEDLGDDCFALEDDDLTPISELWGHVLEEKRLSF